MAFELYKIVNSANDKIYIGQTTAGLPRRWGQHLTAAKTGANKLYNAMRKYGAGNFRIERMCTVNSIGELNEIEEFIIRETGAAENGYNIQFGGLNFARYNKRGLTREENEAFEELLKILRGKASLQKGILLFRLTGIVIQHIEKFDSSPAVDARIIKKRRKEFLGELKKLTFDQQIDYQIRLFCFYARQYEKLCELHKGA